jgi:plasmid replication initiation protein
MVMAQITKDSRTEKMFYVSTAQLMKLTGTEIKVPDLKKATERLNSKQIAIAKEGGGYKHTAFIASAEYIDGKGLIEIQLSAMALSLYMELKQKFTTFELGTALNLSGKYSKRLYEIMSMYKNFPNKTFTVPLNLLKERMEILDSYPSYSQFERAVIKSAQMEMDEKADVTFTYTPILAPALGKGRRGVESIKFTVHRKEPIPIIIGNETELIAKLMQRCKLRKDQAIEVVSKFSEKEINQRLYDMAVDKDRIKNIGGYAAKLFGV